jgi:hypothetical protein
MFNPALIFSVAEPVPERITFTPVSKFTLSVPGVEIGRAHV